MNPGSFEDHIVFEKIEQLKTRLLDKKLKEELDSERFEFYKSVHKYISDRLKLTIPLLVQEAELNNLSSEIEAGLSQINSYLGNSNEGHLTNANNNFFSALNRIRNLPLPFSKSDFDFSKSVASFQKTVDSGYQEIRAESKRIQDELSSFQADLSSKKAELEELNRQIEERESEIEHLTKTYSTNYETIKSDAESNHVTDRERFREEIDSDRKAFREAINSEKETFRKEIDQLKNTIKDDTANLVSNIIVKLDEAKKIVNVVGNVGVTGNYQIVANQHKKTADFWRLVAVIFMTLLSGILIYTIWDISGENFDWTKSLIRVLAAAALSYPATYAARESSKHRKLETMNRPAELELASINPFIEILDDTKKQEIKEKLVEKYFGNSNNPSAQLDSKGDELSIGGFEKLIKALLPFVKK